eukprot:2907559-Rhodomonas_salina.1
MADRYEQFTLFLTSTGQSAVNLKLKLVLSQVQERGYPQSVSQCSGGDACTLGMVTTEFFCADQSSYGPTSPFQTPSQLFHLNPSYSRPESGYFATREDAGQVQAHHAL